MRPTVATSSRLGAAATRSTPKIISLAAASASRRAPIGTVPAWPAKPVTVTRRAHGAVDGGDGAERRALRLQHRPLLDVQLEIGGDVALPADAGAVGLGVAADTRRGPRAR